MRCPKPDRRCVMEDTVRPIAATTVAAKHAAAPADRRAADERDHCDWRERGGCVIQRHAVGSPEHKTRADKIEGAEQPAMMWAWERMPEKQSGQAPSPARFSRDGPTV